MTTALIDTDIILYEAGFSAEKGIDWSGDGDWSLTADLEEAKAGVHSRIQDIKEAVNAERVVLTLTDPAHNFRKDVYPTYKDKRVRPGKKSSKPMLLKPLREFVESTGQSVCRPGLEADDVLGILATTLTPLVPLGPSSTVICSIDKDLLTIPGKHYNWRKPELGVFEVSEWEADLAFYKQILTGDATDNYPGCPGCGPVGAVVALDPDGVWALHGKHYEEVLWRRVVAKFATKNLTEADALTQARCARILRGCDYNFDTKEVILWTPPSPQG